MKKLKRFFDSPLKAVASCTCILAVLAILGVGAAFAVGAVAENTSIGVGRAQDAAFADAGVAPEDVVLSRTEFEFEKGRFVYEVDFTAGGMEYEYLIHASDGKVISRDLEQADIQNAVPEGQKETTDLAAQTSPDTSAAQISLEKAKEIALADANIDQQKKDQLQFSKEKLEWDDGRTVYEIEFFTADFMVYEYEIDASTGAILSKSEENAKTGDGGSADTDGENALIRLDEAKEIAAQHAGFAASEVSFSKAKLDRDDGRTVYEVVFYKGSTEYEYTIDAAAGTILEYDID